MSSLLNVFRAPYLALLMFPLACAPSWAKDLTQQDLANMAQASAVRMGCGVSIGVTGNLNAMGPAFMNVFLCSGLVLGAVKLLPKESGASCWNIIRSLLLYYFWTAIIWILGASAYNVNWVNTLAALWIVSAIIAIPAAFAPVARMIKMIITSALHLSKAAVIKATTLYVRVNGSSIILKQGLRTETRSLSLAETVARDTAEKETCQIS